ncbi:MAG: DUF885 domain-containing protein [Proteobacteria bacterium]|nr:DUF885 domain-containing protein [Pseudomonadota bacterium]
MSRNRISISILALVLCACSKPADIDTATLINQVATDFVDGYYAQYPEEVYEIGYLDAPQDRFGGQSEQALLAWDARVDSWLATLDGMDLTQVTDTNAALTYVFAREKMQAIVDRRICKTELWNISPEWTGWQFMFSSTLAVQPVDTAAERAAALARLTDAARYIRNEISNLRRGQDLGYTAGQNNVVRVIEQVTALLETPAEDSPLYSPAARSTDADFIAAYKAILQSDMRDAMLAYRDFLANDYQGHDSPGVSANPDGAACYAASVRYWSSISMDAEDIHRKGLSEMARIQGAMLDIAKTSFGIDDVPALLEELRTNPQYTFSDEQAMLDYVNAAIARGKAAVGDWFGNVPDVELLVTPFPAYEKNSGGGWFSSAAADGSRPATYLVGTYNPTSISKAGQESTAFHESYPGHHLQSAVALANQSAHPILRYMFVSGSAEGWALYTEKLADEMGLYSSEVARLGMLSNEAYRAARLVVDPGMHVMGWSRDDAIKYMLDHTAESPISINSEVDRYSAVPGQATSYLIGSLEIQRLRQHAEDVLGERFDIREFHDRLLEHGGVTLPMLGANIESWIRHVQGN